MLASFALLFKSERDTTGTEYNIDIDDLIEEWFAVLDFELDIGE